MGVPEEIRKVERPKNTVVLQYGKNKDRYAVRQRTGCKSVNGRKIPVEGAIIGHIVNGKYVPIDTVMSIRTSESDYKQWANIVLCDRVSKDIFDDLLTIYTRKDAEKIFCIAALRALEPDINDYELGSEYKETWLSEIYPGTSLSKNTVGDFLSDLGHTCSKIISFMRLRAGRISADHHLAVDGTLVSDESKVNSFSDYSRKALKKGTKDISVVFAYDVETGEPVCSKAYPGNRVDISVFEDFIRTNQVFSGVIIADRGFSYEAAKDVFQENPDLHFLIPLKRNASIIKHYHMYDFNSSMESFRGVPCKKESIVGGKFLYSFQDLYRASQEGIVWIDNHPEYDSVQLKEARKEFGSITFISDLDLDCETVYKAYDERWDLEVMFMFYKDILMFDQTKVHEDCSVIGTQFINFLSILITYRLRKEFAKAEHLKGVPHMTVLKLLKRAVKFRDPDGTWRVRKMTDKETCILVELGIFPNTLPIKNSRGRPKRQPVDV